MSDLPNPVTREQYYLKAIAENGSGGGSDSNEIVVELEWEGDMIVGANYTYGEILSAYNTGKYIFLYMEGSKIPMTFNYTISSFDAVYITIDDITATTRDPHPHLYWYKLGNSGEWDYGDGRLAWWREIPNS